MALATVRQDIRYQLVSSFLVRVVFQLLFKRLMFSYHRYAGYLWRHGMLEEERPAMASTSKGFCRWSVLQIYMSWGMIIVDKFTYFNASSKHDTSKMED